MPWPIIVNMFHRRKMHGRNPTTLDSDPIIVNSAIVDALRTYVETGLDEVACVAAKFLDAFMHHAQLVEAFEVDNFIFRNGSSLCTWYVGCYPHGASSSSPQCVASGNSMLYKRQRYPDFARLCCCAFWSSTRNHSRPFCRTSSNLAVPGKRGEHDLTHFQSHWR